MCNTEFVQHFQTLRDPTVEKWGIFVFILVENDGLEIAPSAVPVSCTTAGACCQQETEPDVTSS